MSTDSIEKQIDVLLLRRDYRKLIFLNEGDRRVWHLVQSKLYHTDERLRWHAIEAVGEFMRKLWDLGSQEKVLDYTRRLIWSISDESGGIGWSAPQTIAEMVVAIPQLSEPFVNIMLDRVFKEPALIKSGLWAIGRLGQGVKQSVELFRDDILASFNTDDPETLGLAAWAMGEMRLKSALPHIKALKGRKEPVRIYINHHFHRKQLGSWAMAAIVEIDREATEVVLEIGRVVKRGFCSKDKKAI